MFDWPTISRMALSATSFTVVSGFWMLKRYFAASWMCQNTTKLMSTMFSSPLSIRTLFAHVGHDTGVATRSRARTHADLDEILPGHFGQAYLVDGIWHAVMQSGRFLSNRFAEAHDDAELIGVHAKGEGIKTDNGYEARYH